VPLGVGLLRRLYAAHGFELIWASRPRQAAALSNAVLRSDEHGLDPNSFHAALIANPGALSTHDRDLLLSDAFLAYADALARGAVPLESRTHREALGPAPVDVVAVLDAAIASADPAESLNALAPNSLSYAQLREAYRMYRSSGDSARAREVAVNLERLRWLPRAMPPDRVEVNTANAELQLFRGNVPVFATRVVVGQSSKQTPEFQAVIESVLFNPPWYVPHSIATREILPRLRRDRVILRGTTWSCAPAGRSNNSPARVIPLDSSNSRCRTALTYTSMTLR
jgi:murein L,D-transpeptidase YcbB/YkuD